MKSRKVLLATWALPIVLVGIGGWYVFRAATRPSVARSGGTILVYELDSDGSVPADFQPQDMADALLRRIDPSGELGVTVDPVDESRFEIAIPRSKNHEQEVARAKDLVRRVGFLEFRILANARDDKEAFEAARATIEIEVRASEDQRAECKRELGNRAARGLPPPPPKKPEGLVFRWSNKWGNGESTYSWVELGPKERRYLDVDNAAADPKSDRHVSWQEAEKARNEGRLITVPRAGEILLYSRRCINVKWSPAAQADKKFEYFVLTRDPKPGEQITGKYLASARPGPDKAGSGQAVHFGLDSQGGNLFYALTSANQPGEGGGTFHRRLAIILDGLIESAPQLNEPIRSEGQISGRFTTEEVNNLVTILRAGALPATLKSQPVSEATVTPNDR
jgi:SecD/SecF fusion protein